MKKLILVVAIATFGTQTFAKDMADIDIGDRVCWTGLFSDSYGRVISKDYSDDTVRIRLDSDKVTSAPASAIRNTSTCGLTREAKDQAFEWILEALTTPSDKNEN